MLDWISTIQEAYHTTPLETFRDFFLFVGWPVLILSSIMLLHAAVKIYKKLEKLVYGRLILVTTIGYTGTSSILGIITTHHLLHNVTVVPLVTPIFIIWLAMTFIITWSVQKWDGEAIELNKLQRQLESLVIERTAELESVNAQLLEMDEKIRIQNKDLRVAKDAAESQEKQIEAILESIGDGVFVVDAKGKIILFNPMAEVLTGYSFEELKGKSYDKFLKFYIEKEGARKRKDPFISRAIKSGKITQMNVETVLQQKDGSKIAVADSAAPLLDEKGKVKGCVVVFRDESAHRRSDRMKTEFVSLVSHQLKTPLTAIRWGVESLEQSAGPSLNVKQRIYLNDTKESVARLIKLVNDLLNVSRLESGRLKIDPKETDIIKLAKKAVDEMRPIARAKNVSITMKKPSSKIKKMNVDDALLFQVIHNLLTNAVRYTEPTGKIQVIVEKNNQSGISISVVDNGIGIPDQVKNKLFNKFFRAENAMKTATDGNGLGLYLVKMVMDLSGGGITYTSEEGVGSSFTIHIPKEGMKARSGMKSFAI